MDRVCDDPIHFRHDDQGTTRSRRLITPHQVPLVKVGRVFTINLAQTEAVQFEGGAPTNQSIPSLWTNYFSDDATAIAFMFNDFSTQLSLSTELDNQVINDATSAGGSDYLLITSLAVRQAFATLMYTGTPDLPYVFLKEISSDGDIQTVVMKPST